MNNLIKFIAAFLLIVFQQTSFAQTKKANKLQSVVENAIDKTYAASVRMWGFDVQRNERTSAQFSGVVISSDGYILTAAHVVDPGKNYKVFFPDGKECIAIALGRIDNKETPGIPDVGMMKITDKGVWPFAEMGYSSSLVKNEPCISISYPESLNKAVPTIRLGKIAETKNTYGFIRSTCKMEPGDSGGPLFDYKGRVIGLHSAIDVSEDMNFEIPVDLYRKYWSALKLEQNYSSFPTQIDSVASDPLASILKKETKKYFDEIDLNKDSKIPQSSLQIQSNVQNKPSIIEGTLFSVKLTSGEMKQFILSKNSMVGNDPKIIYNHSELKGSVLKRDQENDLVLIEVTEKLNGAIEITNTGNFPEKTTGILLVSILHDGKIKNSVGGNESFSLPKTISQPFFGAMVAYNSNPAIFSLIKPESPAANAGIKVGDELTSINGVAIKQASNFASELSKYWPNDTVEVEWKTENVVKRKAISLAGKGVGSSNHPVEKFEGGKSERRDGFISVFTHDASLKPSECGSAAFNQDGVFYGINIARYSRAISLTIPAKTIYKFVNDYIGLTNP